MTDPVTISLLGEPVPWAQNSSPVAVGDKVRYRPLPKRQRDYFAALRFAAGEAMKGLEPLEGPLKLAFLAELPIRRSWPRKKRQAAVLGLIWPIGRPDLDKLMRLAKDAMKGVVYRDDAQICKYLEPTKRYGVQPKLVITVAPL